MKIPKQEYFDRIAKFQANMKKAGLDACLVHGTESDFANVRYLSEYWPTFEQAGVFVPATGDAILLIGPESEKYARGRSVLDNVHLMLNYRESAEPDYPGIPLSTFDIVAKQAMGKKKLKKLGLVGTAVMTKPTLDAVAAQLPGVEVVVADEVKAVELVGTELNILAAVCVEVVIDHESCLVAEIIFEVGCQSLSQSAPFLCRAGVAH